MKEKAQDQAQGYYGHCSAIDQCIGDITKTLQKAEIEDNTIFIFTVIKTSPSLSGEGELR